MFYVQFNAYIIGVTTLGEFRPPLGNTSTHVDLLPTSYGPLADLFPISCRPSADFLSTFCRLPAGLLLFHSSFFV